MVDERTRRRQCQQQESMRGVVGVCYQSGWARRDSDSGGAQAWQGTLRQARQASARRSLGRPRLPPHCTEAVAWLAPSSYIIERASAIECIGSASVVGGWRLALTNLLRSQPAAHGHTQWRVLCRVCVEPPVSCIAILASHPVIR